MNLNEITMGTKNQRKSRSERLKAALDNFREPNEDTKRSIDEAIKEKPFQKRYINMDELFEDMAK